MGLLQISRFEQLGGWNEFKVQAKAFKSLSNKAIPLPVFSCEFCEFLITLFCRTRAFEQQSCKKAHIVFNIMINSLKRASFLMFLIVFPHCYF